MAGRIKQLQVEMDFEEARYAEMLVGRIK